MPERAAKEVGADPVAMAALNELLEASLEVSGRKKAGAYLKVLSARVANTPPEGVVPMFARPELAHTISARRWLEARLPIWLSRYG